MLFKGLNEQMKDELASWEKLSNLNSLVPLAIRLDNNLRKRCLEKIQVLNTSNNLLIFPNPEDNQSARHSVS